MISQQEYNALWTLIKDIKVGMLVSHGGDELRSRPMYTVQDEFHGRLFFFTSRESEKVDEINHQSEVCVSYAKPESDIYVSCSGAARLNKDEALIDKFWNPMVAVFFPDGKKLGKVALLEVKINKAETWDADKSKMVQLFEMAKADIKNEMPDLGENRKYS